MVSNKNLLVIRLSAMGDVAMTVPVLSALIQHYPGLKITVLTKSSFTPMFAQLRNVKVVEAKVKGEHQGLIGLWRLYRQLRALKIDAVADLHNVLRSNILKLLFRSTGVPVVQIDKGRSEKKALTASKNKIFKPLKTTHQRYADVFGQLGFPVDLSNTPFLSKEKLSEEVLGLISFGAPNRPNKSLKSSDAKRSGDSKGLDLPAQPGATLTPEEPDSLSRSSAPRKPHPTHSGTLKKPDPQKYLGIAPFAAFEGKMYPLSLMEKVIEQLNATQKYKIFLFGGGEKEKQKLQDLASPFKSCINLCGTLSLSEELTLISNLDAMLSMDSGNGHLAAMYGVPVVTLWGVTHPYAGFYPFGQDADNALLADREKFPLIPTSVYGNKMPVGYEKAIETILPEDVAKKIEHILM